MTTIRQYLSRRRGLISEGPLMGANVRRLARYCRRVREDIDELKEYLRQMRPEDVLDRGLAWYDKIDGCPCFGFPGRSGEVQIAELR